MQDSAQRSNNDANIDPQLRGKGRGQGRARSTTATAARSTTTTRTSTRRGASHAPPAETPGSGPSQSRSSSNPPPTTALRTIRMVHQNPVAAQPRQQPQPGPEQPPSIPHLDASSMLQGPWQTIEYAPNTYHPAYPMNFATPMSSYMPTSAPAPAAGPSRSASNPPSTMPTSGTMASATHGQQGFQAPREGWRPGSSSSTSSGSAPS